MKITSALFLLLLTVAYAQAETPKAVSKVIEVQQQYDIEIIIFEDTYARYINSETWPAEDNLKEISEDERDANDESLQNEENADKNFGRIKNLDQLTLEEINETDKKSTTHFENIPPQILTEEYKKIDASTEQNVLLYASWRQTGLDQTKAYEIKFDELTNNHEFNKQTEDVLQNKSEENSIPKNKITGHFKVVLSRYLHFYSQLNYQRYQAIADTAEENSIADETDQDNSATEQKEKEIFEEQIFPIKNHRRMRSKELHYIDHPLIGMLIQINPTKIAPR